MKLAAFTTTLLLCTSALAQPQMRTVTDTVGREVEIPVEPQRVVSLNEALLSVPIMELGLPLVGSFGRRDDGTSLYAVDFVKAVLGVEMSELGIKGVGPANEIDIEKVRALKPDVIIGTENNTSAAETLSTIAPVYLQRSRTKEVFGVSPERELAETFGKTDRFAALEADYKARIEAIRAALPVKPEEQTFLGVVVYDQLAIISNMSGAMQALQDLGFQKMQMEGDGERSGYGAGFGIPMSSESFARINPDLLVMMNSYVDSDQGEEAIRARLDKIVPGWSRFLRPEEEGRILFLDTAKVVTPSLASANHTLDAFEAWAAKKYGPK